MPLDRTEQCCGVVLPAFATGSALCSFPSASFRRVGASTACREREWAAGQGRGNTMKIAKIEDLHCNAGWRDFSFLKITTDDGLVGWSEYNEGYGSAGLTAVIRRMAQDLIGHDPRPIERIMTRQYAITRQSAGGMNAQAMAAIENALLDVKAKALGVPVYELFGGPVRDRLPLYWSHCGSDRFTHPPGVGGQPGAPL